MVARKKIGSNETNAYFAEEASIGVLPANPVWWPLEPNSYSDFGGELTLLARNPINSSRQRKKGAITDLDASGGLNQDFTQSNIDRLMQGFMFADFRRKVEVTAFPSGTSFTFTADATANTGTKAGHGLNTGDGPFYLSSTTALPDPLAAATPYWVVRVDANTIKFATSHSDALDGTVVDLTDTGTGTHTLASAANIVSAADDSFLVTDTTGFAPGQLILASGFGVAANNGVHLVTDATAPEISVDSGLADEAVPPSGAMLQVVGFQGAIGDFTVTGAAGGEYPYIATTLHDFTDMGLIVGEWIYVGGDGVGERFVEPENNGFKRIVRIEADKLYFDRSTSAMVDEAGTGLNVSLFFGRVLKNELGSLIKLHSYHLERQLGAPDSDTPNNVQAEYLKGAVASELTLTVDTADKLNVDMSFIALDNIQRTAAEGILSGTRKTLPESDMYNTSSDIKTMRMSIITPGDEAPEPLFGYLTSFNIVINNNLTIDKAIAVLGGFDVTAGTFQVSGEATAYFSSVEAVKAVRNNENVSMHMAAAKNNAGFVVDMPLIGLGNGRLDVTQDQPITLPLSMDAATAVSINPDTDYTLMWVFFDYLPTLAEAD